MASIAELFATVGFKIDESNLLKFKLGLAATATILLKFTSDVVKATAELDNFEKRTGISSRLVREWQLVAESSNVGKEAITQAFSKIGDARANILTGQGNIKPWALLGVDPTKDHEIVFQNVIDKISEIQDFDIRNKRIIDLGLDPQIVNLIGKTKNSISDINKSLIQTDVEKKAMLDLNKSFKDLMITLGLVKEKFASYFFPLKSLIDLFKRMIDIVVKISDATIGFGNAIKLLAVFFAYLFASAFPLTALFIGLALVIEDIWTYFEGGESVIGLLIKNFKNFSIETKILTGFIAGLIAIFTITKIVAFATTFATTMNTIKLSFLALNKSLLATPLGQILFGGILAIKGGAMLGKKIAAMLNDTDMGNKIGDKLGEWMGAIVPDNKLKNNAVSDNRTTTNTFNIDGAKSPQETARQIFNIQDQINSSSLMLNAGY